MVKVNAFLLVFLALTPLEAAAQADGALQAAWHLQLRANHPYETDFKAFRDGIVSGTMAVRQSGAYCDVVVEGVEVLTAAGSRRQAATSLGQGRFSLNEPASAVNVLFHQETWDNAACDLLVYGEADGPGGGGTLLGALHYDGGFTTVDLPLAARSDISKIRLVVPQFCDSVEILETGTLRFGRYNRAERRDSDVYVVPQEGVQDVDAIRASINGPLIISCDIPVYGEGP